MKRDPLWTAIEVLFTGIGAALAVGVCRVLIAAIEWVGR